MKSRHEPEQDILPAGRREREEAVRLPVPCKVGQWHGGDWPACVGGEGDERGIGGREHNIETVSGHCRFHGLACEGAQFRRCLGGGLWGHVAREGGEELGLRRVGCVLLGKYRAGMMLLGETSYARAELCLRVTRSMRRYPGGS